VRRVVLREEAKEGVVRGDGRKFLNHRGRHYSRSAGGEGAGVTAGAGLVGVLVFMAFVMRVGLGKDRLHFGHRDHREITAEEEEQGEEETEGTHEGEHFNIRGEVPVPGGGEEVAGEAGDDNDETFETTCRR